MKKPTKKYIESKAKELFETHANRVQFNIMDLSKVLNAARKGLENGTDGVNEIKEAIERYKVEV